LILLSKFLKERIQLEIIDSFPVGLILVHLLLLVHGNVNLLFKLLLDVDLFCVDGFLLLGLIRQVELADPLDLDVFAVIHLLIEETLETLLDLV
jgi:hypothetical protein